MFDIYLQAFATVLMPQNLIAMRLGALWGLLAGALPKTGRRKPSPSRNGSGSP